CSPMGGSWRLRSRWGMSSSPGSSWRRNERDGRDGRDVRRHSSRAPGRPGRRGATRSGARPGESARDVRPAPARGREPEGRAGAMEVVAAVKDDGQPISSSLIRTAVAHGDLASAERGLGRPYSLRAVVERGAGRGRTIGVPTINLTSPDPRKLLPPDGVYAVRVEIDGKRYDGMMNQGPRPTFGVHARGLEIHLFDFTGDVYGASVTVAWARRLRDTQTFPSRQALVDQIERDAIAARAVLK